MSSFYPILLDEGAMTHCDNCGHECKASELGIINDAHERLHAGEEVPAGECQHDNCGALAYLANDDGLIRPESDDDDRCCDNEARGWNGGCMSCGDPAL